MSLMLCRDCGHAQLLYVFDPHAVYDQRYTHRSSISALATQGNDFFCDFLEKVTQRRSFRRVVEVGCNDLYLLRRLQHKGEVLWGVDPIWRGKEAPERGKLRVLGKFIEEVDLQRELGGKPDLILSANTFEHIDSPRDQLQRLMEVAEDNAIFVTEVPGFDSLLNACRFDQIIHQHIQYFSLASFRRLIDELGGTYLTHTFNYSYWSGTMLTAFTKTRTTSIKKNAGGVPPSGPLIKERWQWFQNQIRSLMDWLPSVPRPLYGFGAAQMLPVLAYHMKSDLSFLECILDDNPQRNGLTYPHLPVRIRLPEPGFTLEDASVLVTALDSMRPILKRLMDLKAKHILVPLHSF